MSYTTNPNSLLWQLRQLMPKRPLTVSEAKWVAERQAARLLSACGIDGAGTPSEIISALPNLKVSTRTDLPASGYTDWYKPHWLIFLNAHEAPTRRRFSLFHELKHILDHPFIDSAYPATRTANADKRAEQIADYFAACVLMPRRALRSVFFGGQQDPDELAAMFGVSGAAMTFRLQELGLIERNRRIMPGKLRGLINRPTSTGQTFYRRASTPALEAA